MTAAAAVRTITTPEIRTPMRPFLQGMHAGWLGEVRRMEGALGPVRWGEVPPEAHPLFEVMVEGC